MNQVIKEFREKFAPDGGTYFKREELEAFLKAKITEALESVVPEEKGRFLKGMTHHQCEANGYNACRKEILSRIETYKGKV